ncbi:MAG: radical SAM protein [bacterium]
MMKIKKLHRDLPIFLIKKRYWYLAYAPGRPQWLSPAEAERFAGYLNHLPAPAGLELPAAASQLIEAAAAAKSRWQELASAPFTPECLTVYLSNKCNLSCRYCFAANENGRCGEQGISQNTIRHGADSKLPVINEQTVQTAAHAVAKICQKKNKRFTLVLHGGGEPTLHWKLLQAIVACTRKIAHEYGLEWWAYIATHGVLPKNRAEWLADHFNLIGLSCDGPANIQNDQRPMMNGQPTFQIVKRTANLFAQRGVPFAIRATITPNSFHRQKDIVALFCCEFKAKTIRFEPVYLTNHSRSEGFQKQAAREFVESFVEAQKTAHSMGANLSMSGVRTEEIHGPYCHLFRNVLHLTPDGTATVCFLTVDSRSSNGPSMKIGEEIFQPDPGFALNHPRVAQLRQQAARIPRRCLDCVNIYHCARDCPDVCLLQTDDRGEGGFRCQVNKLAVRAWFSEMFRSRQVSSTTQNRKEKILTTE